MSTPLYQRSGGFSMGWGTPASGIGIVEGWRGTIVRRVELAPDGAVTRLEIVDPSSFD